MKKIIVIGSPGAGKSTFARKLRDELKLPLHYLDMIWHKPNQTNISVEEFDARLAEIMKTESWIIDGNYLRTLEMRLAECDAVFLLDFPVEICMAGAAARIGKKREDMPWTEWEMDSEFEQWIADFPHDQLPVIYELLDKCGAGKNIIVFKTRAEADAYFSKAIR